MRIGVKRMSDNKNSISKCFQHTVLPWLKKLSVQFHIGANNGQIPAIKEGDLNRADFLKNRIGKDQQELEVLSESLAESVEFLHVLPNGKHANLRQQLFDNERVHMQDSIEDMIATRVGDREANKRCFARVVHTAKKEDVTAGIFVALTNVSGVDGRVSHQNLPGDIDVIKNMPVTEFVPPAQDSSDVAVAVLYTISSNQKLGYDWEKGGRSLASNIYQHLNEESKERGYDLYITTLSPVRGFNKWLQKQPNYKDFVSEIEVNGKPDLGANEMLQHLIAHPEGQAEMRKMVMQYMVEEKDPVMNFHLGNGAYIGDINFNSENSQDWVMMNYVYAPDADIVGKNSELYVKTKIRAVAPHLQDVIQESNPELLRNVKCIADSTQPIFKKSQEDVPVIAPVLIPVHEPHQS